ncbi:ABC transporter substrate-binding protein [Paraglaciecola sp.]|uniref:ABC transporter substrate-binding protein n=1 Tax=Paraglaciecola sp. TaxID=1920173 RepID=UPI00273FC79C|nr:extracellular solute-binding protein [Paraglaciecola sp.]MDP5033286.1 extracellular solute-binding protein [Paraglaciecola sp.]
MFKYVYSLLAVVALNASVPANVLAQDLAKKSTLVIAEHRAARLEALYSLQDKLEQQLGVQLKIVEYPAPAQDYFTKLVTELRAGNAPDVFTIPRDLQLDDLAAAGYLVDLSGAMENWDGYQHLPELIKLLSKGSFDGHNYAVPSIVAVEQLYYRHDLLEQAGISTAQPTSWDDLLNRARQIKHVTGQFPLLFPAGLTWGMGSYTEGYRYLLAGFADYQLLDQQGRYRLGEKAPLEAFKFYQTLVDEQLMPIKPLLNPEPWVIPKYEMFPKGQLMITTCGTWCRVFDWGENSRNPIANIEQAVGTWKIPSADGSDPFVLASMVYAWAVNAKSRQADLAIKLALALGDNDVAITYAQKLGNVPARLDAELHPDYASLGILAQAHKLLPRARALRTTVGSNAVMAGVARATEAVIIGREDAAGAQQLLEDYVSSVLGDEAVSRNQ